jgi:putative FmdB family regulatory protein
MPVYEYRCDNGHTFEVVQRMSDAPVASCEACGAPVQRVFHPVAVHFKGSGFYTTDYGRRKAGAEAAAGKDSDGKKEAAPASSDKGSEGSDKSGSGSAASKGSGSGSDSGSSSD